jgi:hypothetical protein
MNSGRRIENLRRTKIGRQDLTAAVVECHCAWPAIGVYGEDFQARWNRRFFWHVWFLEKAEQVVSWENPV